jgi:hypothetical protein
VLLRGIDALKGKTEGSETAKASEKPPDGEAQIAQEVQGDE